ncbi:MAG: UDP-N-acetylmuramate--L-alanine ligase [Chloroflexia bacterium]
MNLASQHWHFIGIGGAGMSALAAALLDIGATVSGSDLAASDATLALEARGAKVYVGHSASNLTDATQIVLTGAVPEDNPELLAAKRLDLPVIKRAALLGQLMDSRRGIAVAGTHGKTTTSAMIAWVLAKAGRDPSYMVGGTILGLGSGGHWGSGPELVAEADEYDRSFLHLRPEIAVITNIETDHLEYYGTAEAIFYAFRGFASNIRSGGLFVACGDDPRTNALVTELVEDGVRFQVELYGVGPDMAWQARDIASNVRGGIDYQAYHLDEQAATVSLQLPGAHNVLNSLSALAACCALGMNVDEVARLLGDFVGTGRRFELKGEAAGVTVIDDYAHHPTELAVNLSAARQRFPGRRLVALFQPHTYTRTRDFLPEFAWSLEAADRVVITEIYASRETDTLGMSGRDIVDLMPEGCAVFAPTLADACTLLLKELTPGDVLITFGAGDVWKAGEEVLSALRMAEPNQRATIDISL